MDQASLKQLPSFETLQQREAYHESQLTLIREMMREHINQSGTNKPVRKD